MSLIFSPNSCWFKSVCPNANTDNCNHACGKFSSMSFMVENSGLPDKLCVANKMQIRNADKEAYYRLAEIKSSIDLFVAAGQNLFICSENPGNGKTTWASRLMMAYFSTLTDRKITTIRGKFISVTEFLQMGTQYFQAEAFAKLFRQVCDADLVIFDDIGVYELSNTEAKILYTVVNNRISNGLSCIFTSNRSYKDIGAILGDHLASRICNTSEIVTFKAGDVRRSTGNV